jgi:hypothetical protein
MPNPFEDDLDDRPPASSGGGSLTDTIRRMVSSGVGSFLHSEEGLRAVLSELKLPKEAASYVMHTAEKTKDEVVKALGRELRGFLEGMDLESLVQRALKDLTVEVRAEVTFRSSQDGQLVPAVKVKTGPRLRRSAPRPKRPR